ncbi:MAG: DUF4255 domain-containing protein [Proteobacteria bacterium]|nr:DUF4255 domain-containing protein [Desulfobulbaceae bacterium]MBU4151651.1 DUF4255 domain-containing protein [Pseudomonadota bacterium]MDP2106722.1 Pvc16 family protein [Desulfobulbaceae bacterium]
MALPQSSLSRICRSVADFVSQGIQANANSIRVLIGTPADAVPSSSGNHHRLNLFFYHIEPAGFFADVAPDEIWRIRLQCLVTPFARKEGQISAGENDLRLLGEVVRLFHENPLLNELTLGTEHVRLEVLFRPMALDEINHIWGTQGEVAYRTSVAYEVSLVPVIPLQRSAGSPLVATTGAQVYGDMAARQSPFTEEGATWESEVRRQLVSGLLVDWTPAICLVCQGRCVASLAFALGSAELTAFTPQVWVAGPSGSDLTLSWEVWDSALGWRSAGPGVNVIASGEDLNPEQAASATTVSVPLPFKNHSGQAVLYAERSYVRPSDGVSLTVRSNPVLINLYQVGP